MWTLSRGRNVTNRHKQLTDNPANRPVKCRFSHMDYVPSSTGLWWQMALRGLRVFPSSSVWLGEGKINIRSAAQNIHMNQRFIDWKIRNNSRNVKVFEDRLSLRSCDGEVAIQDRNPCLCGIFMPNEVKVDSRPSELAALTKTNVCVHSTWQRTAKRKKMTAVFAWPSGNLVFLFCHLSSFVQYSPQYDVSGEEAGRKCSDVQSALDCLGHWCSPCALAGCLLWAGATSCTRMVLYVWSLWAYAQLTELSRPFSSCLLVYLSELFVQLKYVYPVWQFHTTGVPPLPPSP